MSFSKFVREESGALAPIFTLSLVPMIALVGAAIDLANMTRAKSALQVALDSTALAVNHNLHLATQESIQTKAQAFFNGQIHQLENPALDPVSFDVAAGSVNVSGSVTYTPHVMHAFGFGPFNLVAQAGTVVGDQEIEVALVLDNSGSMSSSNKIDALENAAESLVETLFINENAHTRIKVGVVPFSGAVNVDSENANEPWMDTQGLSPIHFENFSSEDFTRFQLFTHMTNTEWKGCVEVRPGDHGVTDSVPDESNPQTLFVPMFAPDESDKSSTYTNDYLDDDEGDCSEADLIDDTSAARQARVCKYKDQKPDNDTVVDNEEKQGPNFWCRSNPIVPLTNDTDVLEEALDDMKARGHTNIHEGLMWGWRVLSPTAPFTQGKAYNTPNLRKYIVLMTDGDNTARGRSTFNNSEYFAYGYSAKNRLGTTSSSTSTLESKMDEKLAAACTNAKAAGIAIYTIAFQVPTEATKDLLEACASQPSMAYTPESNSELEPVFQTIARDLGKLRISH